MPQDAENVTTTTGAEPRLPSDTGADHLLSVRDLRVAFGDREVLHGIDLDVRRGERVAIVGQSGSGKSTLIAALLRLLPGAGHITGGDIRLGDDDIAHADERSCAACAADGSDWCRRTRRRTSTPRCGWGTDRRRPAGRRAARTRGAPRTGVALMTEAGIPEAGRRADQYPHEFSGGMRQRILIAVALARQPELLIADEPTSALDVTVQRQILDHLQTLVDQHGTTLLFVTHDLGVAADRTDRVVVMLDGEIVEQGAPRRSSATRSTSTRSGSSRRRPRCPGSHRSRSRPASRSSS